MINTRKNAKIEPHCEVKMLQLMNTLFKGIGYVDTVRLDDNMKACTAWGGDISHRTVDSDRMFYLCHNMPYIIMALMYFSTYREACLDVIMLERRILNYSWEEETAYRRTVRDDSIHGDHEAFILISFDDYDEDAWMEWIDWIQTGYKGMDQFDRLAFNAMSNALRESTKVTIGQIAGCFIYILRALSYNDTFYKITVKAVNEVKAKVETFRQSSATA